MTSISLKQVLSAPTRSIYAKCIWITALVTLLVVAALSLQNFRVSERIARDGVRDLGATATINTANALGGAIRFEKLDDITGQATQLLNASGGRAVAVVVLNQNGDILAEIERDGGNSVGLRKLAQATLEEGSRMTGNNGLDIAMPVIFGQTPSRVGVLAVSWTVTPIMESVNADKLQSLVVAFGVMILMLSCSVLLLRRIIGRPLQRLQKEMELVAAGNFEIDVADSDRKDEVGRLARSLDRMRDGLAEADRASNRVRADQEEQQQVIATLTSALKRLASGDMKARIDQDFSSQYSQLKADFNDAAMTLHDTLRAVIDNAHMIHRESDDIGRHSGDLSQRTENQAATLEETAAALDQLTGSVKAAADGAKEVEGIVQQTETEANESGKVVKQTVTAMSEIENSSEQISKIISVIDDIAFQTNLLALNAGVEAARAGEAGRGFAVVASEVRALAQRSSEAAQEIKTLISGSSEQVARGVKLVGETGSALTAITDRVVQIAALMSNMASAATEQSRSLAEINIGVGQLDKATQQNAGMVESADAASQTLRRQAADLTDLVSRFNIAEGDAADRWNVA